MRMLMTGAGVVSVRTIDALWGDRRMFGCCNGEEGWIPFGGHPRRDAG